MIVPSFFAAESGSFDATISLTTASPSRGLDVWGETEPCKQCRAFLELIPAASNRVGQYQGRGFLRLRNSECSIGRMESVTEYGTKGDSGK